MTDRVRTATVLFDRDFRIDDVETVLDALRMIKGVADVSFDEDDVTRVEDYYARRAVSMELGKGILDLYQALVEGKKFTITVE